MTGNSDHIHLEEAERLLAEVPEPFAVLMRHGHVSVELFRPHQVDLQQPHAQDELYVVLSGQGWFWKAGEEKPFKAGDVIFVPAGVEHRFVRFSDDFQTYVIFL